MRRINFLKSISHHQWRSDRSTLLYLYVTLIRSPLDYGAVFYDTSCESTIKKLDVIQNQCLRIAAGIRQTSPISSLEVETGIPPLSLHRKLLNCKYYFRIKQFPVTTPIVQELFLSDVNNIRPWSKLYPPLL